MSTRDNNDDDILARRVPEPDDEPTSAERAHAKTFGELVDKALAGRTPAAMSTDDRALLEVATVIRAAGGEVMLPAAKRAAIIEDALRIAVGGAAAARSAPIARGKATARRWLPWTIAGASTLVAAAAVIALWARPVHRAPTAAATHVPAAWRSRSADALIGPIERAHAGDAGTRIDAIFADRLDGFRDRSLLRGVP
jgi:hypothetical protein